MIYEKIDLYKYFGLPREDRKGGYLTAYVADDLGEIKPKKRPGIIVLPGGGYGFLSRREAEPVAIRFLGEGYAAFVLEYEVLAGAAYPTPLLQACMAIKYLRDNAEKYKLDAEHIATVGFSAGGHLAGLFATRYGEPEITKPLKATAEELRPDAAIFSYAVLSTEEGVTHWESRENVTGGDKSLYEKLSVDKAVCKTSAPAFIWHTATDDCVPVENSFRTARAYQQAGVPFELHVFEQGWHGLSLANSEVYDDGSEGIRQDVAVWVPLALTFLKKKGFAVKTVG